MTLFGCQWTSNPRFLNLKDLTAHMQVISNNFKPTFFPISKTNVGEIIATRYTHLSCMTYDLFWPLLEPQNFEIPRPYFTSTSHK
jgi:hypothetical protein